MNDGMGEITPCYRITFHRSSRHSARRMWSAITVPAEISRWMDYPAQVDLRPGGDYRIDFSRTNDEILDGVIVRVEAELRLTYLWGLSVCEWTLEDVPGSGCNYTFVQNGLTDRGNGEEGLAAGWHEFFDRLDLHLDGRSIGVDEQKANWERLRGPYLERLNRTPGFRNSNP